MVLTFGCVIRGGTCDEINDKCVDVANDSLCDDQDPGTTDTCDLATGDFDADPCFPSPMGKARADRTVDHPDLALCLSHRRARLLDALQMVPASERDASGPACKIDAERIVHATTEMLRSTMI